MTSYVEMLRTARTQRQQVNKIIFGYFSCKFVNCDCDLPSIFVNYLSFNFILLVFIISFQICESETQESGPGGSQSQVVQVSEQYLKVFLIK